jgi:hypothetical protein
LYHTSKTSELVITEAALRLLLCATTAIPAQLDRLSPIPFTRSDTGAKYRSRGDDPEPYRGPAAVTNVLMHDQYESGRSSHGKWPAPSITSS